MRRVNGYNLRSALRSESSIPSKGLWPEQSSELSNLQSALRAKDSRLKNLRFPKVSNLKMDIDETENPFGDGVGNRGVDDDDENIPLISTSSRRGSEDTNYCSYHSRTHGETSFIEGIDEHTPLIRKKMN